MNVTRRKFLGLLGVGILAAPSLIKGLPIPNPVSVADPLFTGALGEHSSVRFVANDVITQRWATALWREAASSDYFYKTPFALKGG